jgi:hypothetical protein
VEQVPKTGSAAQQGRAHQYPSARPQSPPTLLFAKLLAELDRLDLFSCIHFEKRSQSAIGEQENPLQQVKTKAIDLTAKIACLGVGRSHGRETLSLAGIRLFLVRRAGRGESG